MATLRWRRTDLLVVLALLVLTSASWFPRLSGPIDLRWDGAVYYVLGTSLGESRGYRLLNEPGDIEAVQYPPLLPAIIAAHQWALGTNDPVVVGHWLRRTYFVLFNIYIASVYLLARSYLPSAYAFLAAVLCLFSLYTYFLSDLCFPEIPFALATVLFFLCNRRSDTPAYGMLAAIFAVAAYALRTSGATLLAVWVGESILRKEFKRAVLRSAVSAVAVLGWMAYISAVESSEQYTRPAYEYQRAPYLFYNVSYVKNIFLLKDPFTPETGAASLPDITLRMLANLESIPIAVGEVFSTTRRLWYAEMARLPFGASWMADVALIVLGGLALGGVVAQLAERQWIIPLYVVLSIAAICLTPWPGQFTRYLAPITPFLAVFLVTLLLRLEGLSGSVLPAWKATGAAITAVVIAGSLTQQAFTFYLVQSRWHQAVGYTSQNGEPVSHRLFFYFDRYRAFDAGIDWLRSRAKHGDVVASPMPQWIYLRTGLKSVMPPFEANALEAQRLLDSVPVEYMIIVDEELGLDTRGYTFPVIQRFPGRWKRVYSDSVVAEDGETRQNGFQIYQRLPS